jgi:hypothetical protein
MPITNSFAVDQLLLQAVVVFFVVWGLVGAAVGAGLIAFSAPTIRLLGSMNHYVSTRHGLKPLAMPHDIGQSVRRHRRLIGSVFVVAAVYSLYGLVAWFDYAAITTTLDPDGPGMFVGWIVESARWFLMLTSIISFVVGAMLVNFPDALDRLEAHANYWYSGRKLTLGVDTMYMTIDNFVGTFPRSTGAIIVLAAVYVAANAALLWFRFR